MSGWLNFILAFVAFFAAHMIPTRPKLRDGLIRSLGRGGFLLTYSALSVVLLAWVILAAGTAPFVPLWDWQPWLRHVPQIGMLAACLLVAVSVGRVNPFSFGGSAGTFDPAQAGWLRLTRHPLLLALALWAFTHLVPNGDLAHVLMFGIFGGFALLGMVMLDRRNRRRLGQAEWQARQQALRVAPLNLSGILGPRPLLRLGAGVLVYVLLLLLHGPVIGVVPY
ncbi:MAG: NnrU family protein [Paracoccus sp. (in: a-proteobacteria)]|uniref:NnrU family protein n=1 Tax=Paracoccus sp. TaxID=267 RepID=UPI0026DF4D71|nr:NnrU family protein [Paracoccus sp. (in: a-proteobacteria)]MDO5622022.1 NnrU family protein [Paracoccus sp. (in: a-proteobacteria)]